MVKVNVNMNTDDVSTFESVDAGKHRAKLIETTQEDSKNSGEPMIVWQWEIVGGDNDGKTIRSYTSLQEHALGGLARHYEAFGYHGPMNIDTSRFHNKFAILIVTKRKGRSRETDEEIEISSVSRILPDERAPKGKPTGSGGSSGSGGSGKPASKKEDDIPF